jgi:hypothetical protein
VQAKGQPAKENSQSIPYICLGTALDCCVKSRILRTMDGRTTKTKEGYTMRYMARLFAVLLVAGSFGVPALYADGGGDYSEPPTVENDAIVLADGGGDRSGPPAEEANENVLV